MRGLAAVDKAQFCLVFRSETKARDNDAMARLRELIGAGERRANVPETTRQQARLIEGNRGGGIGGSRVVQISAVQEVRELDTQVEAHPLPDSPGTAEVDVLVRVAGVPEIAVVRRRGSELARR